MKPCQGITPVAIAVVGFFLWSADGAAAMRIGLVVPKEHKHLLRTLGEQCHRIQLDAVRIDDPTLIKAALEAQQGKADDLKALARHLETADISLVVLVNVVKQKQRRTWLNLVAVQGAQYPATVMQKRIRMRRHGRRFLPKNNDELQQFFSGLVTQMPRQNIAQETPHSPTKEPPDVDVKTATADPVASSDSSPLQKVNMELFALAHTRRFSYRDVLSTNLRGYSSSLTHGFGFSGSYAHPLSFQGAYSPDALRVSMRYAQDTGEQVLIYAEPTVDLSHAWREVRGSVDAQWTLGQIQVMIGALMGQDASSFKTTMRDAAYKTMPGVRYLYVGPQISARLKLASFSASLGVDYRRLFRSGRVGEVLFPHASVGGAGFQVRVEWGLFKHWRAFAGFFYNRYFYDLRPRPGDTNVAGGALDQQTTTDIGLQYAF